MPKLKSGDWIPDANDVAAVHADLTKMFEDDEDPISPPGIKSRPMLESACGRPLTSMGATEKYPSLVWKLAALTQSLTKNHPFHNGNKRTALATLLIALYRNKLSLKNEVTDDQVFDFIVAVTADEFPKMGHKLSPDETTKTIAWWIKNNTEKARRTHSSVKVDDFVERCRKAGMLVKFSKGYVIINPEAAKSGKQRSIRISGATRQINGPTERAYVQKLGIAHLGNEFYDGVSEERAAIRRFIGALRRLART